MNGWPELDRFLRTDPRDVGCAQATEILHVYAELVAAGEPAGQRYPGIAAHLQASARAAKTSTGCWPRCAARHADRHTRFTVGIDRSPHSFVIPLRARATQDPGRHKTPIRGKRTAPRHR